MAALDFASLSGCDQLIFGSTQARARTLDHLMTKIPDPVIVGVVVPIGHWYSHHSFLSVIISIAQFVPNLGVSRKVFLKHQLIGISLRCNTGSALEKHLAC